MRASDLHSMIHVQGMLPLEVVERVDGDESEMFNPSMRSESIVQFAPTRFSTLMSEREGTILNVNNERQAFFLPKSFSAAVTNPST